MESGAQYKKQYDEVLAVYTKKKLENDSQEKNISMLQVDIKNLASQILKFALEIREVNIDLTPLQKRLQQLQTQIQQANHSQQHSRENEEISRLISQKNRYQHQLTLLSDSNQTQLLTIRSQTIATTNKIEQEKRSAELINDEIEEQKKQLAALEAEIALLQHTQSDSSRKEENNQIVHLQNELRQQNRLLAEISNQLQEKNAQNDRQRSKLQQQIRRQKQILNKGKTNINNLQQKNKELQEKLLKNQNQTLNKLQNQIKKLQNKNSQLQKQVDSLVNDIERKKAEKNAHQEQLKKYKEKKAKNYTQQISNAEKNHQNLIKQLEREKNKLADASKLSKSYVSQQNLQILQKQLNRHQTAGSKFSVQVQQSKKAKLLKQNESLKSRIQYLKNDSKKLQQETQAIVKALRQQGDDLVKQKLANEKIFNQTTNKLNEYMKEYPNHEKNKQLQKLEEKKRKAEEKQKLRDAIREQKEKKKEQLLKAKAVDEPQAVQNNSSLPAWQKWDKQQGVNLPAKDQTSIFNNPQYQIAFGVFALISILLLVFG